MIFKVHILGESGRAGNKHSNANGFYGNNQELKPPNGFDGSQWTFPKELQKAGYNTATSRSVGILKDQLTVDVVLKMLIPHDQSLKAYPLITVESRCGR